jgi:hypothetical protein
MSCSAALCFFRAPGSSQVARCWLPRTGCLQCTRLWSTCTQVNTKRYAVATQKSSPQHLLVVTQKLSRVACRPIDTVPKPSAGTRLQSPGFTRARGTPEEATTTQNTSREAGDRASPGEQCPYFRPSAGLAPTPVSTHRASQRPSCNSPYPLTEAPKRTHVNAYIHSHEVT